MASVGLYKNENKSRTRIEAHRPTLSKQELESVLDCLIEDRLGSGTVTRRFERTFAQACGSRHALAVNSLGAAYHLAFLGLGAGPNTRVLMSALAPVAACDAARYTGARVELIDVDRESFHPAPDLYQERAKALLAESGDGAEPDLVCLVDHSFGSFFRLPVEELPARGARILEDFTGLVGTQVEDSEASGRLGQVSVCGFSEYDLITTGNGGMILTGDSRTHGQMQALRYGGPREKGSLAYDYRLEDFQAAMGLDQLSRLGVTLARRKRIGVKYLETVRSTRHVTHFREPEIDCYLQFPVILNKNMDEALRYFAALQIGVERSAEMPLHHLLDLPRLEYPNAERFYQRALNLPIYPSLTANNVERVASALRGLI